MLRRILTWMLVARLPASPQAADTKSAVLHNQGGVWVNGMEAADARGTERTRVRVYENPCLRKSVS
jgi:hypothetical protein